MDSIAAQKETVRDFWNAEPCGSRYLDGKEDFEAHARARYELEPYIFEFARFREARDLKVLEVGVGMGADYLEWLKAGAHATGVDLSAASLENARRRCMMAGYQPDLRVADAEQLPFPDQSFDVVYSYGVMHHSPNTPQCIREAYRVLKSRGTGADHGVPPSLDHRSHVVVALRIIARQNASPVGLRSLESPGTKTYTREEALALFQGFADVKMQVVFSPGDLLLHQPSARFQSGFYRLVWKLFPRAIVRKFGRPWGLFLLISAVKPK